MCYIREWFQHDAWNVTSIFPRRSSKGNSKGCVVLGPVPLALLAARRQVARLVLTILRSAAKQRAIALYWQEQTRRASARPAARAARRTGARLSRVA